MNKDLGQQQKAFSFEELLRFYQEAGVDIGLLDHPINRLTSEPMLDKNIINENIVAKQPVYKKIPPSQDYLHDQKAQTKTAPIKTVYIALDEQIKLARDMAMRAKTLAELHQNLLSFDGCPLKITAKNTCFADGNANSPLMVIGDVPERDEDIQGLPFVGQAGALLNKMLVAINFNRENTYITNVVPWRPPGNREPTPHEIEVCKPFIYRQIELANPKIILAFGGTTTTWLTGTDDGILRMRGSWLKFTTSTNDTIDVMPTLHPRYLLRNPAHKKFAWQDLLTVKMKLSQ